MTLLHHSKGSHRWLQRLQLQGNYQASERELGPALLRGTLHPCPGFRWLSCLDALCTWSTLLVLPSDCKVKIRSIWRAQELGSEGADCGKCYTFLLVCMYVCVCTYMP